MRIYKKFKESNKVTLFNGDCRELLKRLPDESVDLVVTSPPYCMGKAYEDPHDDLETFKKQHQDIFNDLYRVVKPGGSICWQIGYHVSNKCVVPLDYIVYDIFTSMSEELDNPLILRNRIVWTFGHGLNSTARFSGRHEMICGSQKARRLFSIWMRYEFLKNIQENVLIRDRTRDNLAVIPSGKTLLMCGIYQM